MRYVGWLFVIIVFLSLGCSPAVIRSRQNFEVDQLTSNAPDKTQGVIKVYLKSGGLIVFDSWEIDNNKQTISGSGSSYSVSRRLVSNTYTNTLNFDQCVLVETNEFKGFNVISPLLMTLTVFTAGVTLPCLGDPKACFGSCPTFYLEQNDSLIIQAEGFSSSITRSMEEEDIDYLRAYDRLSTSDTVRLQLMNEAYETHYIRKADLVAIPGSPSDHVYHNDHEFYTGSQPKPPIYATSAEVDVSHELSYLDREEYLSATDSADLTAKESIILTFEEFNGLTSGIIITQRQSLLTTYLFYSGMAQMGSQLGAIMAAYENTSPLVRSARNDIYEILGEVEVSVLIGKIWKPIGTIHEQGPIVSDTHLIPINLDGEITKVRLTMTRGLWQIDQVGVVELYDKVDPVILQPVEMLNNGLSQPSLLERLNNRQEYLVNNPGASYSLVYKLPDDKPYTLFLDTQGYYTEWMRSEWLAEENYAMTKMLIKKPKKWLKKMSSGYKKVESEMNELFWLSKFGYNE